MDRTTREERRGPRYRRKPRHAEYDGGTILAPIAKDCIFAAVMLALCLCIAWGVSAMYQKGYAEGYEDAKAAYHG